MSRVVRSVLLYAVCSRALAGPQLPIPCAPGACAATPGFVTSGAATAVQSGSALTVHQTSNNATLNWSSFNIGTGGKVVFQQPTSSAVALNRIYDSNPSSIFGALTANGQIYLINANGFLFGSTSVVNVAGLIASSLNLTDSTFTNGILAPLQNSKPALEQFTGNSLNFASDSTGASVTNTGTITVQNGAQLTAADQGRLLLAAPTVQNGGTLTAPDGQIILAAGQNIYLQASNDTSLRGLIVQVDGGTAAANQVMSVVNQSTGVLSAPHGNITLTGLMINQDGRISATTSVSANGSVTLEAAEDPVFNTSPLEASVGGQVTLGQQSSIEILPDYADTTTAVDAQVQLPSKIAITGEQVLMQGGTIRAPSGTLTVTADANPSQGIPNGDTYNPDARIHIDAGTTIDLSGSDATLPMAANLVTVQLRSNEFADDPTQRNGALRGQTVTVDIRADSGAGTPIADVSSAIAAVGYTVAERTETGGTATFESEGDIVFNSGASINVSGGATTYLGGTIQTTQLIGANGAIYNIGSANPLLTYTGLINPTFTQTYDKWGVQEVVPTPGLSQYQATYQQGAAAGTVQFAAPALALDGSLQASAISGPYQRSSTPLGGTLIIGRAATSGLVNQNGQADYLGPPIEIATSPGPLVVSDTTSLPPQTLQVPVAYLTGDGFTNTQIYSNTTFALPAGLPLQFPAGTSFLVQASRIDIDSSITDLGGVLSFQSELTVADQNPLGIPTLASGGSRTGIGVGEGVTFDVSGLWTNDSVLAGGLGSGLTLQNAGSINLQLTVPGSELVLGADVALLANGGAWEQSSGALSYGRGGSITLDASPSQSALQFGADTAIAAFGAYDATGGSFSLLAPRIEISQGSGSQWTEAQRVDDLDAPGQVLQIYAPLFADYGFSNVSLIATGAIQSSSTNDVLSLQSGSTIVAQTRSLQLDPSFETRLTGGTIADFSQVVTLPDYLRPVTNVSLAVLREADDTLLGSTGYGTLDIEAGTSILADPNATISIEGEGSIAVAGTLRAPGGRVSVELLSPDVVGAGTASIVDPGYVASLGITLAPTARIDVSSAGAVLTPNNQGLLFGTLDAGGSVDIDAERGTLLFSRGSVIDVSGGSATLDVADSQTGGYLPEVVASAAGSLTLGAVESLALLGTIEAKAGVGSSGAAAGGSLEIDLTRTEVISGQPDSSSPLQIDLVTDTSGFTTLPAVNVATVGLAQIADTGIDALTLNAGATGLISIQTGQPLVLNRSLVLEAAALGVADGISASLGAPYVQIGNPLPLPADVTQPVPSAGTGTLIVTADQLDLVGALTLQGLGNTTLRSLGDVQLQGIANTSGGVETGSLLAAGNITIQAARVYPDTFTSFTIEAQDAAGAAAGSETYVNIDQVQVDGARVPSPGTPLSGGGSVSVLADNIEIGGTLMAPFGQIALDANDSLTLSNGSLVSVSGRGLEVPYGQTQEDGAQWVYVAGAATQVTGTPEKQVTLTASNTTVQPSATVDLQGGGDLYAYEWVPGTGGSTDALAGSGSARVAGLYAILPAEKGQAGPYDPEESVGFGPSETVYLSAGAGVAAGYYALLPPRYALEPGALLIEIEPSYTSAIPGQIGSLANGTPVLAGYLSSAGTSLHLGSTEYEGFAVYPGSYGEQLAAYNISDASTYFSAAAALAGTGPVPLPADAGTLTFSVVQASNSLLGVSFDLQGTVQTAAAAGGRGALVNISAPNLEIDSTGEASSTDAVAVSSTVLQNWDASAVTLGGSAAAAVTSTSGVTSVAVSVAADQVTVDPGATLTADQIFVVAQQSIDIKGTLSSTSGKAGTTLSSLPAAETVVLSDASAALVAVSDVGLPVVARSGSGAGATITLESSASLESGGALALDAPGNVIIDGTLKGKGASWSLASNSIAFVPSGGNSADTLNIDPTLAASLQAAGAVRLSSQGDLDLYAPVALGASSSTAAPTLSSLTLLAAEIDNTTGSGSTFGAAALTLGGSSESTAPTPVAGGGQLSLIADNLTLAPNVIAVSGFAGTLMQVAGSVTSTPVSTSGATASAVGSTATSGPIVSGLNAAGDLTINAVELTPGAGSQTLISASGSLTLGAPSALAKGTTLMTFVGGAVALSANSILDNGVIAAPSGVVSLDALAGSLELGRGASIDVAGTLLQAVDRLAPSPGGMISLSATGNVSLDSGSMIDVAGEQVAPAGSLSIVGGQTVTLAGTLEGAAGTGGTGGSFTLDAGQLTGGLAPLASSLTSGGFSQAVSVRARSGDLDLPAGQELSANSIVLTADTGAVEIAGVLNAQSGAQTGLIDLSAGTGVSLDAGGQLHADGTGTSELGGEIEINSTCAACSITLAPGSVITAAGTKQMGELILRAPTDVDGSGQPDVAINVGSAGIGADVSEAGTVIVEPVLTFATSGATVNTDLPTDIGLASTYLASATSAISARLTVPAGVSAPAVQVGVELIDASSTDTLTLQGLTDLSTYSDPAYYGSSLAPQVIDIGVRAAGSININGTLSDGFVTDPTGNSVLIALSNLPSASFSFVAGADTTSANPLSVVSGAAANLTLMSSGTRADGTTDGLGPSVVRTGTGDIDLAAAGDIVFAAGTGGAAAVYTAGLVPANVLGPVSYDDGVLIANFGSGGGNVRISAGGSVQGAPVGATYTASDGGNYGVGGWQLHQGSAGLPAQYGIDYGNFDWNVGALGGGDVSVVAGGSVESLSAAVADTLVSAANTVNNVATLYGAGGGLSITAGGDIGTAQVFVADGTGTLIAGGGVLPVQTVSRSGGGGTTIKTPVGSSIAIDDSQVAVWARNAVQIDAIYNPTNVGQLAATEDETLTGAFLTYGTTSGVSLSSTAGAVTVELLNTGTGTPMAELLGSREVALGASSLLIAPPNLTVQALQNNIIIDGEPTLAPAPEGQLSLFAALDIEGSGSNNKISMSDAPLTEIPTAADPSLSGSLFAAFLGVIHTGDPNPALVTAGLDIDDVTFSIPKAAEIVAGRDILNFGYEGQNVSPEDTTLISAGRDLIAPNEGGSNLGIQLSGPGNLDVMTGRNLNLGLGNGIVTLGDLVNPNLPTAEGANVTLMVGYATQGADLDGFLDKIILPSSTYQAQLVAYVESLDGSAGLSFAQAETDFESLSTPVQSDLIDSVFFNELLLSGRAANSGSGVGFAEGYAAIDALFPGSRSTSGTSPYSGDLTLTSSQIYTDSGGNISILVPGGQINVGLANPPPTIVPKPASSLGIVAEGTGNVNIYTEGDVNVNTSRIFTLGGGNILIWSDEGSIDAGNGSKSSLSVPPPTVTITRQGLVTLNFGASLAAGSGIRTIQTNPSVPPGDVDLDAPVGTVNAGDAGIGASGNINIAAAHVIGVDNINFGGTATGVPSDLSGLAASLSGVSAVAAGATTSSTSSVADANANKETAPIAQTALSWLDVFVTGLGEENCKQDDIECLKRQKAAAP